MILSVFAPRNAGEFARILRPEGRVVVVIPTERHLAELREVAPLLAIERGKRRLVEESLEGFSLRWSEKVMVPLELGGAAIQDLIEMTPNAWYLTEEQKRRLAGVERISVTAEFEALLFAFVGF